MDLITRVSIAGEGSKEEDKESESSDEDERDSKTDSESSDGSSEDQEIEIDFQVAMWDVGNLYVPMHTKFKTIEMYLICPW